MQELKTLPRTGCKAFGRKFSGFAGSPFLYISDIAARFHGVGKCCEDQRMEIMLDRRVRSIEHFLNMMILMPSRGQGELRDFIERMIFSTSRYEGLVLNILKEVVEGERTEGIQDGLMNCLLGLYSLNTLPK